MFEPNQPYNHLPLLPPAIELETKVVLKQAISANRMLANLRGLAAKIPNQGVLINSIFLQEARLSSEIENIVTTNDELYRAAADADGKTDAHTKEVLRYREALFFGFQALKDRPLTTNLFIELVRRLSRRTSVFGPSLVRRLRMMRERWCTPRPWVRRLFGISCRI